jgi:hypothetical protein
MLIRMVLTGAMFTLTTAAALAYGMYDGTYRGNLIGIGNNAPGLRQNRSGADVRH